MPVILKTRREIEVMRRAGEVAGRVLQVMKEAAGVGVTTGDLDELARRELEAAGAKSLSKNYQQQNSPWPYPRYTCVSVNEEVVHGVPGTRKLKEGDIATLDVAMSLDGFCVDTAITVPIGPVSTRVQKLLDVTQQALDLALMHTLPGKRWSEIARLVQHFVESHGFNVIREFVGHGIGRSMHEDPKVPNFVTGEMLRGDFRLRSGMTLAIEPMVVMGGRDVVLLEDQWTVVTQDRLPAAHFEHTVAVVDGGVEILTRQPAAAA